MVISTETVGSTSAKTTIGAMPKEERELTSHTAVQSHVQAFMKTFSVLHFFDPYKPWVLVPNGSFGGNFDWIPEKLRVGPWSTAAVIYLSALWYGTLLTGCYYYSAQPQQLWTETDFSALQYAPAYSWPWCYHVAGCAWMVYIMYSVWFRSPLSYRAWSTYTVQSWTLLAVRHGLCALTPWYPRTTVTAAEVLRFPCAVAHTVTFTVWNFVLVPYLLFHVFKDDAVKRRNFVKFCTSFRLTNLHIFNIVMCVLNVGPFGSPPRRLEYIDLYIATGSAMIYMTFYLCVLDRLGVHLYPVFSPRDGKLVLVAWTGAALLYLMAFFAWCHVLWPNDA